MLIRQLVAQTKRGCSPVRKMICVDLVEVSMRSSGQTKKQGRKFIPFFFEVERNFK